MKALTLHQPWASLIAVGAKRIETRSWRTDHRGPLAIHAGRAGAGPLASMLPFATHLEAALGRSPTLPRGRVVAVATLVDVVEISAAYVEWVERVHGDDELVFGDYTPGRHAWLLDRVCRLQPEPEARGWQGLWDWTGPDAERTAAAYVAEAHQ